MKTLKMNRCASIGASRRRKYRYLLLTLAFAVAVAGAGCNASPSSPDAEPAAAETSATRDAQSADEQEDVGAGVNLRVGFAAASDGLGSEILRAVKESVEGDTGATVEIFDGGALGGERDMLAAVQDGTLDMAALGSGIVASVEPAYHLTELPYLWDSREQFVEIFLDGPIGRDLLERLGEGTPLKGLALGDWTARHIFTTEQPVHSPADVQALSVRALENPIHVAIWEALGANPSPIPFPELYTSLEQGIVDGVDNALWTMTTSGIYEVLDHATLTSHNQAVIVLVMNEAVFDGLPTEVQTALVAGAKEGETLNRLTAAEWDEKALDVLNDAGVEVVRLDRAQDEDFREATNSVVEEFRSEIGIEILDAIARAKEDYQAG